MLTREVREWLRKVESRQYSYEDAMSEFMHISRYLTREELLFVKNKIKDSYNS